jgi:hypothetical protein
MTCHLAPFYHTFVAVKSLHFNRKANLSNEYYSNYLKLFILESMLFSYTN